MHQNIFFNIDTKNLFFLMVFNGTVATPTEAVISGCGVDVARGLADTTREAEELADVRLIEAKATRFTLSRLCVFFACAAVC